MHKITAISASRYWREAAHELPHGAARRNCLDQATQIEYANDLEARRHDLRWVMRAAFVFSAACFCALAWFSVWVILGGKV